MFTVEALLSARLNHPNIVQIFEFAEVEGERYLAMEYVPGINVGDLLRQLKGRPIPLGMAAHMVREVSLALAYAHALSDEDGRPLSLIHRDVSPSNVMLGYDGSVKLLDFGVAKALSGTDELTRTGALKGKVAYMSPEAVDGELSLDGRTDIFAAGVVLYELLTGKRLFKAGDDLRTIALVRACKVDPPSRERPEVPPELDQIVMRALARDRDQRYQSGEQLAADLTDVVRALDWEGARSALFLKQHDIQPGSEPELRAPARASEGPPATRRTVVERRGRSSTSVPAVVAPGGRPRLRWAMGGAVGALLVAGALGWIFRLWSGAAAAPPPALSTVTRRVGDAPPASLAAPAAAQPPPGGLAALPGAPADVRVDPPDGRPGPPASEASRQEARKDLRDDRRRGGHPPAKTSRRPRRIARPAAAASGAPRPAVDLKRGDVLKTF